jgi:hypothetical protein
MVASFAGFAVDSTTVPSHDTPGLCATPSELNNTIRHGEQRRSVRGRRRASHLRRGATNRGKGSIDNVIFRTVAPQE